MDRHAQAELSREQLIEPVLGLAAEVAELKAQQGKPPKTPGNSSVPSSVEFKASRVERRARKRRRGHDGISRRRQAPDLIVRCRPRACRGRGEPLPAAGSNAAEADRYTGLAWAVELRHLFGRATQLHQIRGSLSPASCTRRRRRIENAVNRLVSRTFLPEQSDTANARRLQAHYREHRASLFVFFDRPACPERSERTAPTNNASEQDLRPSVIHRRVTGGFRSQLGADVSAILTSLLTTARKRGEHRFQAVRKVAALSPLDACSAPAFVEARAA